jgi:hypothetical protein
LPAHSRMPAADAADRAQGEAAVPDLLAAFGRIPDPRDPRGIRHRLPVVLALAQAAVLCGCTGLLEITEWIGRADQASLRKAGCRAGRGGDLVAPHPDTVARLFARLQAQHLADAAGAGADRAGRDRPRALSAVRPGDCRRRSRSTARRYAARSGRTGWCPTCWPPPPTAQRSARRAPDRAEDQRGARVPAPARPPRCPLPPGRTRDHRGRGPDRPLDRRRDRAGEFGAHYVMTIKENSKNLYAGRCAPWTSTPRRSARRPRTSDTGAARSAPIKVLDAPEHVKALYPHVRRSSCSNASSPARSANGARTAASTAPRPSAPTSRRSGSPR